MAVILWCWVDKGQGKKNFLRNFGKESIFSRNTKHTELFSLMSTNNNLHFCCWSIWAPLSLLEKQPERRWDIINRAWLNAKIIFWDRWHYYYCSQALRTCYCFRVESTEKKKKKKRKVPPEQYYHFKNSLFEVKHLIKPFENVSCKRYAKTWAICSYELLCLMSNECRTSLSSCTKYPGQNSYYTLVTWSRQEKNPIW